MGYINLPSLDDITQIKDPRQQMEALLNTVGILMKSLSEINGYLESKNIKEVGGYRVNDTDLASKDGDVGMSSANDTADPIRFWAGNPLKEAAPWRVSKTGKMHATGATIQSASGYPRVELDPDNNLFGAYKDAQHWLKINSNDGGAGVPSLQFFDQLLGKSAFIYFDATGPVLLLQTTGGDIQISAGGNLVLNANGKVLIKGVDVLNTKADKSAVTKTVYVAASSGGSPTTPLTVTNGVVTS